MANLIGASVIVAADRLPHRLTWATQLGAAAAVDIGRDSPVDAVMDLTGCGAHVVVDPAGNKESINSAISCLRPGGRMVLVGIPSTSAVSVNFWSRAST